MDVTLENSAGTLESRWAHFGREKNGNTAEEVVKWMDARAADSNTPTSSGASVATKSAAKKSSVKSKST
jgi:hypothetical protein